MRQPFGDQYVWERVIPPHGYIRRERPSTPSAPYGFDPSGCPPGRVFHFWGARRRAAALRSAQEHDPAGTGFLESSCPAPRRPLLRGLSPNPKRDDFKSDRHRQLRHLRATRSALSRDPLAPHNDDGNRRLHFVHALMIDRASIGDFVAHDLGASTSRLWRRSSVISCSIELQTRERPYDCGLKLYFARAPGQKCFPQHNPVTG